MLCLPPMALEPTAPAEIVYLALGTNLGDREANLREARAALNPHVQLEAASPIYETEPWGISDQPRFLNQVICGQTHLSPRDLLDFLKKLEAQLGRKTGVRYGPRLIDLDILFFGSQILESTDLVIPHPHLQDREFVLVPLADLAPDLIHPRLKQSITALLTRLASTGMPAIHPIEAQHG